MLTGIHQAPFILHRRVGSGISYTSFLVRLDRSRVPSVSNKKSCLGIEKVTHTRFRQEPDQHHDDKLSHGYGESWLLARSAKSLTCEKRALREAKLISIVGFYKGADSVSGPER